MAIFAVALPGDADANGGSGTIGADRSAFNRDGERLESGIHMVRLRHGLRIRMASRNSASLRAGIRVGTPTHDVTHGVTTRIAGGMGISGGTTAGTPGVIAPQDGMSDETPGAIAIATGESARASLGWHDIVGMLI